MKLFVSPHNDDAVLFGAFTLQRDQPLVLTVFDSYVQRGISISERRHEDFEAMLIMGCALKFGGVSDSAPDNGEAMAALQVYQPTTVWLPAEEPGGHPQHNLIARLGREVFRGSVIHYYLTYTTRGKSTGGRRVDYTGRMLRKKLQALACYKSQIEIDALGCAEHFIRDQSEYML
jgi:LmbE family N-acetylglucosaminyl deacetylase